MNNNSLFIANRPSFLEGMGRLFDYAGAYNQYNHSASPEEADTIAMEADWTAIADELREAFGRFDQGERE